MPFCALLRIPFQHSLYEASLKNEKNQRLTGSGRVSLLSVGKKPQWKKAGFYDTISMECPKDPAAPEGPCACGCSVNGSSRQEHGK